MSSEVRKFFPEAEKVWHKDYQCNYYRGVIIDGEDHIVERCTVLRAEYEEAVKDAEKKMAISPLYAKQTNPKLKEKFEEYKRQKAEEDMKNAVVIFNPKEWNEWQYIYDSAYEGGLYRFRYLNQNAATSTWIAGKSKSVIGPMISTAMDKVGKAEQNFFLSRVECESDIEKLPGHKEILQILAVLDVTEKRNHDSKVTIRYVKYNNITEDFGRFERTKKITIKRKWPFYEELMEYIALVQKQK